MNRWLLLFSAILAVLGASSSSSQAQVLVYKVEITNATGVNFFTFEGGYVVAPLLGGATTTLLTTNEGGRTYTESSEGATLFTAITPGGDQKAVLSASTGGDAGAIVAIGEINHVVRFTTRTLTLAARVAKSLKGTLVNADDESEAESAAVDGSLGSAGFADVKLSIDEELTKRANKDSLTFADGVDVVKLELDRQNYRPEGEGGEDDDDDDVTTNSAVIAPQE